MAIYVSRSTVLVLAPNPQPVFFDNGPQFVFTSPSSLFLPALVLNFYLVLLYFAVTVSYSYSVYLDIIRLSLYILSF